TISLLERPIQQIFGNLESDEIVITLRRVVTARYLQDVETELRFQVRRWIVRIRHLVSELLSQFGIKQGHGPIDSDRVAFYVRTIMRYRTKRERIFFEILRLIQ